ncbi:hypothetical protein ACPOLB_19590 [Rubrivivax sp. RP6-9]|uniref:hypothetical protein n=1 Tax=Rubrivivax sp. RP6-9 TaxID=3415750 RepID=UPI003CC68527
MAPVIPLPFETGFKAESVNGKSHKTGLFTAVEKALDVYVADSSKDRLQHLTNALAAWKRSKHDAGKNTNWTQSVRYAAVHKLSEWLVQESTARGLFPVSRSLWGSKHNCYAYAMKCQEPTGLGQISWTGCYAEKAIGTDYVQGVVEDGLASGKQVLVLPQLLPSPVPPRQNDGTYLVAMVSNRMGFHFMRRRESTGLWSHKNGGASPVDTCFYDTDLHKPVAITDEVALKILEKPTLIGCSMTFTRYLRVPRGVQVGGNPGGGKSVQKKK